MKILKNKLKQKMLLLTALVLLSSCESSSVQGNVACTTDQHSESNSCSANVQSCLISNGEGTQTWNGSAYGACTVSTCDSGYFINANSCIMTLTTTINHANPSTPLIVQDNIDFTFSSSYTTATFICSLDGSASGTCSSPQSYSGLIDGNHSFLVRAVDSVGNVDPVGATYSWTINTTTPVITTVTPTVNPTSMTIKWTTSKPTTTRLSWGPGASISTVVPEDFTYVTNHSVTVTGLTGSSIYSYIVSGQDPSGFVVSISRQALRTAAGIHTSIVSKTPSTLITQTGIVFVFASNLSNVTYLCSLDGVVSACSSPQSYSALANGNHTLSVRAVDSDGDVDSVGAYYSWTVDDSSATATITSISSTTTTITVTWTTDLPTSTGFEWGRNTSYTVNVVPEDFTYTTNHSVTLTGTSSPYSRTYQFLIYGHNQTGGSLFQGSPTSYSCTPFISSPF